jgi:uncharacterized protein (TIGR00156 family)
MKGVYGVAALCVVGLAAHAQTGGFSGPDNRRLVTAIEAADMPDNTSVRLVGYIVESVGEETYTFRDETGAIAVEIDADEWNGLDVSPNVRVEITGEVDRDLDSTEIDVDAIRLAD